MTGGGEGAASPAEPIVVESSRLREIVTSILASRGLDREQASTVAEILVDADLRGVHTHGVTRLPMYVDRLETNTVNREPAVRTIADFGGFVALDGDNGMGFVVSRDAMELCVERAAEFGVAFVAVGHSNHFGAGAYYVEQCANRDTIGIAVSNGPPVMAPTGSRSAYFGADPLAVGLPVQGEPPIILDMATTVVAQGRIMLAAARGEAIPEGWALDSQGRSTTDPEDALRGVLLPVGGHKGSGIALAIEALTGVLVGGSFGARVGSMIKDRDRPQDVAHAFVGISLAAVPGGGAGFRSRVREMVEELRRLPLAEGVERLLLPGEREHRLRVQRLRDGVPLEAATWTKLVELDPSLEEVAGQ